jgi:hypothetical protein
MRQLIRLIVAASVGSFAASAAQSLTITTASLGGNQVCTTLACSTQTHTFGGSSAAGSGGSITLSGTTLTFAIAAGSASFTSTSADPNLSLTNLSITGSATVMAVGGGSYAILSGSGSVAGNANATAFTASLAQVGGTCTDVGGGLSCGITLAYVSTVPFGASRAFSETVNVHAPEPSAALMIGAALLAFGAASRRRR